MSTQRFTKSGLPYMPIGQAHTLETIYARSIEEGECWIWQGTMCKTAPVLRHGRKIYPVRRYIAELLQGKRTAGLFAHMCCGNLNCVAPDHIRLYTRKQLQQSTAARTGYGSNPARVAKLKRSAEHRYQRAQEQIDAIRNAEGSMRQIARDTGVCFDVVRRIRNGETYQPANNPWMGLGARA
jgi:hypothetical protein